MQVMLDSRAFFWHQPIPKDAADAPRTNNRFTEKEWLAALISIKQRRPIQEAGRIPDQSSKLSARLIERGFARPCREPAAVIFIVR